MTFAENLKNIRISHGYTLKYVANTIGLSLMAYAHYEYGDREPSISTLIKLCDFFDVSADYLIGRSDY